VKKYLLAVAMAVCLFVTPVCAEDNKWSTLDTSLFVTYTVLNVADMLQTRYIFESDDYVELNPLLNKLGKNGAMAYMAGINLGLYFAADLVGKKYRPWLLGACSTVKLGVVGNNYHIGVGFRF
jgi:hypothetical protein